MKSIRWADGQYPTGVVLPLVYGVSSIGYLQPQLKDALYVMTPLHLVASSSFHLYNLIIVAGDA